MNVASSPALFFFVAILGAIAVVTCFTLERYVLLIPSLFTLIGFSLGGFLLSRIREGAADEQ